MEITVRKIDREHCGDINLPNEPFEMYGRIVPSYMSGEWRWELTRFPESGVCVMAFPDENYDYDSLTESGDIFLGAYDGEKCVGLAILEPGFFKYMYLSDLKVNSDHRGRGIGRKLIEASLRAAALNGYAGVYTIGQDNNPGACLFYLGCGFRIGGIDTDVYRHTPQEGKTDIIFYSEAE